MRIARFAGMMTIMAAMAVHPARAESVAAHMEAARAHLAKGDPARAAMDLETAVTELRGRMGKALAEFLPAPPRGWQAEPPETQNLGGAGGGMAVSRAYARDDASINATLVLDSPAVAAAGAQMEPSAALQANTRRIKVGAEDGLLRWDAENRSGEVVFVTGGRVLLLVEGEGLASSDQLMDAARAWNLGGIRKYLGL